MPSMDSITLENFRCFRERQTVRLAPLTLLVGENSTGKTSLLALIRAMAELAFDGITPNFKDPPYDLGSFNEIVHHRGRGSKRPISFAASISTRIDQPRIRRAPAQLDVTFHKQPTGSAPIPVYQRISTDSAWVEENIKASEDIYIARIRTNRGQWELQIPGGSRYPADLGDYNYYIRARGRQAPLWDEQDASPAFTPVDDSPEFNERDREEVRPLSRIGAQARRTLRGRLSRSEPFASAPVRSRPRRTYEPSPWERDPEGGHIPMRLADLSLHQLQRWEALKGQLENFGRAAGLFDEIDVDHVRKTGSEPFHLRVRKGGKNRKGLLRNLIDVGYGISQALPIVTELTAASVPTDRYLLQQPEVHLHPSAQAALGTLFCQVAASGKQLIVETHSDHLIDRVRMDVRDGTTDLTPADVSLLYFERNGLDVKIHALCFDERGNVLGAPPGYRQFFLEEVNRSLGL